MNRRQFCQVTGLSAAGAALGCGGSGNYYNAGKIADQVLNNASMVPIPDHLAWVCRDDRGLYAMSAYCSHAHCVLAFNPADTDAGTPPDFSCSCHGSTFDYNGQNQTPPAPSPLTHLKLVVDHDGKLFIDPGQVVDPNDRL